MAIRLALQPDERLCTVSYSIADAFDHVFGIASPASREAYERRRWFRRPAIKKRGAMNEDVARDISDAEARLARKVAEQAKVWATDIKLPTGNLVVTQGGAASGGPISLLPPRTPYDVFAFAAYVVETAGIYHHIQPTRLNETYAESGNSSKVGITHADREQVARAAKSWANLGAPKSTMVDWADTIIINAQWTEIEPLFESWWVLLSAFGAESLIAPGTDNELAQQWWKHAWRLMAIADEAARGTAYQLDIKLLSDAATGLDVPISWFEHEVMVEHSQRARAALDEAPSTKGEKQHEFADITSLSVAREALLTVLPKVRTSPVGCTIRSLSHHLALLPGTGVVKSRWTPQYVKSSGVSGGMPDGIMNLLLVPLPYSLDAQSFVAGPVEDVSAGPDNAVPRYGYFDVNQHWIGEVPERASELVTFVQALIREARTQSSKVHGLIFPELALSFDAFKLIRDHIGKNEPGIDILVSGLSTNELGERGNFVGVASFGDGQNAAVRDFRQTVREKHHRWKLERTQLKEYGLLGVLSPELSWWENIPLKGRRVDFTVLRKESVLAAMICEDLARVDPCQQVIRAVGPNLVVALLMDAPQLAARWPARYATVLAEDPGCSVLTLTSRGLMTRQHRLGIFRSRGDDRVVGLWRDDRNIAPTELKCPWDAQAVLLTIASEKAEDISLDGRCDNAAKAWRYVGDMPVRLADAKSKFAAILGAEDTACW